MAKATDRVTTLLEGVRRNRHELVTPEGVPLDVRVAGHMERLFAFSIDMAIMGLIILGLYAALGLFFFHATNISVGMTLILFVAFLVRNMYFVHFELAWQGRTPGKKIMHLRVVNRNGGELTPAAIIARNLTREVEVFFPMSLFASMQILSTWESLAMFGWAFALTLLPLFNRYHLRPGDIIAGTLVIAMPKRVLLADLADSRPAHVPSAVQSFRFSHEQLALYGAFELQVLEEFLRRPEGRETDALLMEVCKKICRKISWMEPVPQSQVRAFLTEFYTAERADLEQGQLFGKVREDKNSTQK